jgi:glycosyl hydrolase family 25
MLNQIITAAIGVGILGGAYLIDLIIGVAKVLFTPDLKWSWKKMFQDLMKAVVMSIGIVGFVVIMKLVEWYGNLVGANLSALGEMSLPALTAAIIGGCVWYLTNAFNNIKNFVNLKNTKVEIDSTKADYDKLAKQAGSVTQAIIDAITPKWTTNDHQTDKQAEPEKKQVEEVISGRGASINPLSRRLADGDNDGGKGWQCSKYAYYLATGIRMNYAPHPDYGPVNGNQMVDYLVNKFGFVRCGKEAGAIFSYNSGQFGHTGVVVDSDKNIVNDANWTPLRVSTHYLNLEAVGATYCKPAGMVAPEVPKPAPAPAPAPTLSVDEIARQVIRGDWGNGDERKRRLTEAGYNYDTVQSKVDEILNTNQPAPQPTQFSVGDVVKPIRLVSYNGTSLIQYDTTYTITELIGDRAVLSARGQVWDALNIKDIEKV